MNKVVLKYLSIYFIIIWPLLVGYADGQGYMKFNEIDQLRPYLLFIHSALRVVPGLVIIFFLVEKNRIIRFPVYATLYVAIALYVSLIFGLSTGCYFNPCSPIR